VHASTAGGVDKAFANAERVGCDCMQIFVKNQKQWKASPLSDETVRLYRAEQERTGIKPVFAHASYLINLASPNDAAWSQSVLAMVDELERCEALGIVGLVVHPGAHQGTGVDAGIARIVAAVDLITQHTAGFKTQVLLEGTAGQGTALGAAVEELGGMLRGVRAPDRVAVCLDTCHLFSAGYDLRDPVQYEAMAELLHKEVTLPKIACMHTNDSKTAVGSRVDRHDHIGKGLIGTKGFRQILCDPRLAHVPRILETAKELDPKGVEWDLLNMRALRRLATPKTAR
jgi:deoxyribonuclease-4